VLKTDRKKPIKYLYHRKNIYSSLKRPSKTNQSGKKIDVIIKNVDRQQEVFLEKSALAHNVNYNLPLRCYFGESFFPNLLRNQYVEKKRPNAFIYQLKNDIR